MNSKLITRKKFNKGETGFTMLEMLINPRKAERHPWELFFVGIFYAAISVLLVNWIFAQDAVLSQYSGILVVTFTVMFSMPFVYYTIKLEENKLDEEKETLSLLQEHKKAILTFLWLFLGFVVAFAALHMVFPQNNTFQAQIETYCLINRPSNFDSCVQQYMAEDVSDVTGFATSAKERLFLIFTNNIYVLIFTLIFSLLFGAGVIFILSWNASVIAAAIGIFANSKLTHLPAGLARFMIHGLPEIAAYFVVALAGGMVSIAIIKHETGTNKFWEVLGDSLNLILIAIFVLFLAALIEVFITPLFF